MIGMDDQVWHNEQLGLGPNAPWSDWHHLSHAGRIATACYHQSIGAVEWGFGNPFI
jgi:hypothetical protein